jgi:hypothetical protein
MTNFNCNCTSERQVGSTVAIVTWRLAFFAAFQENLRQAVAPESTFSEMSLSH